MPLNLFKIYPRPDEIPTEMQNTINEIKMSPSKEGCLKTVYEILTTKYHGSRVDTYLKFLNIFTHDIKTLWNTNGFMHCTNINYLMKILLIKSGMFEDNDIRLRWTLVWYVSPHQYIQVKVNSAWINIDIWASSYGIKFGDYAHGFH